MSKRPPEVDEIVTENFLSGRMTDEEVEEMMSSAGPEDDDGSYQFWENGVEYRSYNGKRREYRSKETNWSWHRYKG